MPDVDRNLYFNNNTGEYEEGYRDPVTHVIHFGSGEPPDATEAALAKATELAVNLGDVEGTGKDGRVTVSDVESHHKALSESPAAPEGDTPPSGGEEPQGSTETPQSTPQAPDGETEEDRARREAEEAAAAQVQDQA